MCRATCSWLVAMISFFVNGQKILLENPEPETKLLDLLRKSLHLTGTKQGCNVGGCGACTVMISKYYASTDEIRHWSVNACLLPVCSLDGLAVTTIEGIGNTQKLHPCQESIARSNGSQCGFCTPGMVMSMYTLLRNNPKPTETEMQLSLHGNLCRCTGYRPILDGFRSFCKDCSCSEKQEELKNYGNERFIIEPSQEVIFPPELKLQNSAMTSLLIQGSRTKWYRPITLNELLTIREQFPANSDNMIVAGNIGIGCDKLAKPSVLIAVSCVNELQVLEINEKGLLVGAAVTIGCLEEKLMKTMKSLPESKTKYFKALLDMLHWFANPQIKNVATIGGNIVNGCPGSDLIPVLIVAGTILNFASKGSFRETVMTASFHTKMSDTEILQSLIIPYSNEDIYVAGYKQAKRRYVATAIVNASMSVEIKRIGEACRVEDCKIMYGGMGHTVIMADKTQKMIIGREWNSYLLNEVYESLSSEINFSNDIEGGMVKYRQLLCLSFFYKFYLQVQMELGNSPPLGNEESALKDFKAVPAKGTQIYSKKSPQSLNDTIGQPVMHLSALEQATGEALYVDDIPSIDGEAYAGLVMSECAHARFKVDASGLKEIEDILGFVSVDDVPGSNTFGDDNFFADGVVTAVGQIIGIVVAKTKETAQRGARSVKIDYEKLPTILTIEEARKADSYFGAANEFNIGNISEGLKSSFHKLEGSIKIGGQKHFYFETCACLVIPRREHKEIELICSSQFLNRCHKSLSTCLAIPSNKVVARAKRIGGGFGGKLVRPSLLYAAIAVAANKFQVPVRIMLDREEDMQFVGSRSPFVGVYSVAFNDEGKLIALDVQLFSNGGSTLDFSKSVMETALVHLQNVYNVPNAHFSGRVCKTNIPSCTAMRAYGRPQAQLIMESIMTHVAHELGSDPVKIREINFINDGEKLVSGRRMEGSTLKRCWNALIEKCNYYKIKEEVDIFNKSNLWKKRGISVIPTCSRITPFGQATALVHVYTDGSVLVTHGGIEMGQGLHTKMAQVCARCLDIPINRIHVSETNIDKVPNSAPTGGSINNDIYGMAIKNACEQIMERLKPFKEDDDNWEKRINRAFAAGVNLSAQGFYHPPDAWEGTEKVSYCYYSFGVGFSMVEVDILTGNWKVVQTDILMDVGDSLNPAIDIGQIEGAFVQGMGLFTMEECSYLSDGSLYTDSPTTYKIPGCSDIPIEMNVTLLDNCPNKKAIFSSKAIGEPPLFLASSVFFAIRDAVKSAREEKGVTGYFEFFSPASTERIRLACEADQLNQ
ncbi:PREDICTED: xanthine dehydrogenase/oxidase-like isoform X2 [Amphimedon queenslandica]|uniref:Xanthine dehydrogenase n=1 Tax=Amphimedon queenslandica TaxID=400682 RepID=A0AAN0IZG6_AMPQE|nr:PREDICTED: xanthine dehydrogenase/oxidase-like isoform X2 [Amphimedon queenslandica]|eukprot:XP_019849927.1 PREDICTED: xanthine dehydrogenase/oxidase-like isoform X2 [Amphimedon queenslandica]